MSKILIDYSLYGKWRRIKVGIQNYITISYCIIIIEINIKLISKVKRSGKNCDR